MDTFQENVLWDETIGINIKMGLPMIVSMLQMDYNKLKYIYWKLLNVIQSINKYKNWSIFSWTSEWYVSRAKWL